MPTTPLTTTPESNVTPVAPAPKPATPVAAPATRGAQTHESPRRKNCVGPGKSWIVSGRGLFR